MLYPEINRKRHSTSFRYGTKVVDELNSKHIAWNYRKTHPNRTRLAHLFNRKGHNVEAPNNHTWFPDNRNHSSDILDVFLMRYLTYLISISSFSALSSDYDHVVMQIGLVLNCSLQSRVTIDFLRLSFFLEKCELQIPKLQSPIDMGSPAHSP